MRPVLWLVLLALVGCGEKKAIGGGSGGDPGGAGGASGGSGGSGGAGESGGSGGEATGGSGGQATGGAGGTGGMGGTGGTVSCDAPPVTDARLQKFSTFLRGYMVTRGLDGVTVGVVDGPDVYTAAYGRRSGVECSPMRTDVAVQFSNRLFVALAALSAAKDGLVDLDAPVSIPGTGFNADPSWPVPTIRQLLAGCAGMPTIHLSCTDPLSIAQLFSDGHPLPVWFEPGKMGGDDTALNPLVVARVLELAEGRTYEEIVQRRVFEPLGVGATFVTPVAKLLSPLEASGTGDVCPGQQPQIAFAAVPDVLEGLRALLGDHPEVVGKDAGDLMKDVCPFRNPPPRFGTGMFGFPLFHDDGGDVFFFQLGAVSGTVAALVAPKEHVAVVVLVSPLADGLAIAKELLESRPGFGRKLLPLAEDDPSKLDEYEGTYTSDSIGFGPETSTVALYRDGNLYLDGENNEHQLLVVPELDFPIGTKVRDIFITQQSNDFITFWRDANGKVYAFRFNAFPPSYRVP